MKPDDIRELRRRLGMNRAAFAEQVCRKDRTVEAWEQGRRQPDPLAVKLMEELARRPPASPPDPE
ncbi:helix-turn-helix domain-containing protein [Alienimonas sp. DA493]|uniref:helix-turn-helix domain-containing protein n=1 Tax=Alienimonas sp. DA493 TaxID=3373605 RepID=UPI0037552E0E